MIGTGYVGLVSGACLADFGHDVVCIDIDDARIDALQKGEIPIYEPGLSDVVSRNASAGRLTFSTDLSPAVAGADVVFVAVGTPSLENGGTDLTFVYAAAEQLAGSLVGYTVVVQKSTAPVGTARRVAAVIARAAADGAEFDVVSNPEFLREGSAVEDFMRPNRVVIGSQSDRARDVMRKVYNPIYLLETPIVNTTLESAEMVKYASNAFLATKISFINEIAAICELTGAVVDDVARGMGLDGRIGRKFLHAGIGYGGSCLPKDVSSLLHVAGEHGYDAPLLRATHEINHSAISRAMAKLRNALGTLDGKTVGLLGLSFKPNTDDLREAPSLGIVDALVSSGAVVKGFDPIAADNFRTTPHGSSVDYCKNAYDVSEDCDAVILLTEWNEFRELDFDRMRRLMVGNVFIDCRNVYDPARVIEHGFTYRSFGRGTSPGAS